MSGRFRRVATRTMVGVVGVGAAAWLTAIAFPQVGAGAKAVPVLARSAGLALPRPFAARVTVRTVRLGPHLTGDLYWPAGPAPAIVLASGGTPEGKDDPRVIRVARSIAGAHRVVFVPSLDLARQTFTWADERRIVEAAGDLRRALRVSVGLLGLSYGGSFCLLAAEDPRIGPLAFVGVFGSYDDLVHVVQGITTGATVLDGRLVPWSTVPEARSILINAARDLSPAPDRPALGAALASGDPDGLSPEARAVYDLLENRDPRRVGLLASRLPASFRDALVRFSPATAIKRVRAPLFILQSLRDPATPPTEAILLHRAVPGSRLALLTEFLHVNPPGRGTPILRDTADAWGAWEFVWWVLDAQQ